MYEQIGNILNPLDATIWEDAFVGDNSKVKFVFLQRFDKLIV